MIAIVDKIDFQGPKDTKFGKAFEYIIHYGGKKAYHTSYNKEQALFKEGEESEFIEEKRTSSSGNDYFIVKAMKRKNPKSNFGRNLAKEQARYSGFAMSYAKDLCVAGIIEKNELESYTRKMFDLMVELDKSLQQ